MAIKLSFNETIRDACDKVREGEESGSSNDVSDSKASNQDIEKERSHSGSGDVISNAQKESKSRYGKAMQAGVSSPKLENRGEFSAIKAFLGTPPTVNTQGTQGLLNHFNSFHNPTPQKIVESDADGEEDDPALSDYWKHYDKEGKKYDKRYFAARQEMSNAALRKVLSKAGSSGLPANVKITTAIDELSPQLKHAAGGEARRQIQFATADLCEVPIDAVPMPQETDVTPVRQKDGSMKMEFPHTDRNAVKRRNQMRTNSAKTLLCPRNHINWKRDN